MDDGSTETEITVVLRWQSNREGDDRGLIIRLEDGDGREWDPGANSAPMTGFLPAGWPSGSALAFKRTVEER